MLKFCVALSLAGALRLTGYFVEPILSSDEIHRVLGEPQRVAAAAPAVGPATIVTWNIERGMQFDRILAELKRLDADIVLLQEVDRYCQRSGYRDVARELAHELDMNWVAAGEFQEIGEGRRQQAALTGQAILSRFAIDDAESLPFEAQARWRWTINPVQPRRGGRLALRATTGGVVMYNTHFESGGDERLRARQLEEITADAKRHTGAPQLIAGDLNTAAFLDSPVFSGLSKAAFADLLPDASRRGPTSLGQTHPIDWIFARDVQSGGGEVVQIPPRVSDHFPVLATIHPQPLQARSRSLDDDLAVAAR
jgi:endonuclease/exonuclease/phosphatase family metal-dependent hydrolase